MTDEGGAKETGIDSQRNKDDASFFEKRYDRSLVNELFYPIKWILQTLPDSSFILDTSMRTIKRIADIIPLPSFICRKMEQIPEKKRLPTLLGSSGGYAFSCWVSVSGVLGSLILNVMKMLVGRDSMWILDVFFTVCCLLGLFGLCFAISGMKLCKFNGKKIFAMSIAALLCMDGAIGVALTWRDIHKEGSLLNSFESFADTIGDTFGNSSDESGNGPWHYLKGASWLRYL